MSDWREVLCGGGAALSYGAGLLASALDAGPVAAWIERIGFPAAVVLAGGWAGLKLARWFGAQVVVPVVAKHVAFVDTLKATTERQTVALERIAESEVRSEATAAKTLEAVHRIEETATEDRRSAAEDRRTHRLALDRISAALGAKPEA